MTKIRAIRTSTGTFVALACVVVACGETPSGSDAGSDGSTDVTTDVVADVTIADAGQDAGDATVDQLVDAAIDAGDSSAAAASCTTAPASPAAVTYVGTTCDDADQISLGSCNPGSHSEVVVRIDGTQGQVWKISTSSNLAVALYLGKSCSQSSSSCASGTLDAGVGIADGPFPGTRTDYFVFETVSTACGPYSITVALQ
jgi:hypothetical protein